MSLKSILKIITLTSAIGFSVYGCSDNEFNDKYKDVAFYFGSGKLINDKFIKFSKFYNVGEGISI